MSESEVTAAAFFSRYLPLPLLRCLEILGFYTSQELEFLLSLIKISSSNWSLILIILSRHWFFFFFVLFISSSLTFLDLNDWRSFVQTRSDGVRIWDFFFLLRFLQEIESNLFKFSSFSLKWNQIQFHLTTLQSDICRKFLQELFLGSTFDRISQKKIREISHFFSKSLAIYIFWFVFRPKPLYFATSTENTTFRLKKKKKKKSEIWRNL